MAIVRDFYLQELAGDTDTFALARDVVTDRVFVLHGKGRNQPEISYNEDQITLRDFLQNEGPSQRALLNLIGTLVIED